MYSIYYLVGATRHVVYNPFDSNGQITSGTYHRETNTIGSKANDLEIARRVIDIKAVIEKIREMVQNVE